MSASVRDKNLVSQMANEGVAIGSRGKGAQHTSLFMLDPATGTQVVRPEHHAKVCKAIRREARRLAFSLYLSGFPLRFQLLLMRFKKIALKARQLRLQVVHRLLSRL